MNDKRPLGVLLVLGLALLFLLAPGARAQTGGVYDLSWNTVDGGGGKPSKGGSYSAGGTAGQPDAGIVKGGAYSLDGGFQPGGAVVSPQRSIYVPVVMRNY